ncbi:unnamed protein product, partial [Brenthis ino]
MIDSTLNEIVSSTQDRFCPSVFIYLGLVVPAIWLIELHKVDLRLQKKANNTYAVIETEIPIPGATRLRTETFVTLIEQFLMLTLIVGRWLLPKGDLTRDQLSQLLLVYIGTAADIIEFFDSFKDEKVATEKVLVLLTLAIWSWSLMQFTVVLTATKSRKSRGTAHRSDMYVILLQIYRLYVLHLEKADEVNSGSVYRKRRKHRSADKKEREKKHREHKVKKHKKRPEIGETSISIISDKRQDRLDGNRIRAIILTNSDEIKELEISKFFKDQLTVDNEKKKGPKRKQKSESSEESLNNIHHTTDDSGI